MGKPASPGYFFAVICYFFAGFLKIKKKNIFKSTRP